MVVGGGGQRRGGMFEGGALCLPAGGGWLNEWSRGSGGWGLASLGLAVGTRCPGGGRGRGGRGQRPFPAGVDGSGPKLADVLPRAAMAPGKLAACECVSMSVCVCARAHAIWGG